MNSQKMLIVKNEEETDTIAVLDSTDIENVVIKKNLEGMDILSFKILKTGEFMDKFNNVVKNNIIVVKEDNYDQTYYVSSLKKTRENGIIVKNVSCEQISYKLIEDKIEEDFKYKGLLSNLLSTLIPTYTFNIEEDMEVVIEISNTNKRKIITDGILQAGQDFYFIGRHLKIGNNWGRDNGVYITIGKNQKNLTSEIDEDDNLYYKVDLLELENTVGVKNTILEKLDSIDISDLVILNDKEMEVDNKKLKILSYTYNYLYKKDSVIELSNRQLDVLDVSLSTNNLRDAVGRALKEANISGGVGGTASQASQLGDDDSNNLKFQADECGGQHGKEMILMLEALKVLGFCFDNKDNKGKLNLNIKDIVNNFNIRYSTEEELGGNLNIKKDGVQSGFSVYGADGNIIEDFGFMNLNEIITRFGHGKSELEITNSSIKVKRFVEADGHNLFLEIDDTGIKVGTEERNDLYIFLSKMNDIQIVNGSNTIFVTETGIRIENLKGSIILDEYSTMMKSGDSLIRMNNNEEIDIQCYNSNINVNTSPDTKFLYNGKEVATVS